MKKAVFTLGLVTAFNPHALPMTWEAEESAFPVYETEDKFQGNGLPALFIGSGDVRCALPLTHGVLDRYGAKPDTIRPLMEKAENEWKAEKGIGLAEDPAGVKICPAETVNFLLSQALISPGEKIAGIFTGVAVYYGACSLIHVAMDIGTVQLNIKDDNPIGMTIILLCMPVELINTPMGWLIWGNTEGRTPFYRSP